MAHPIQMFLNGLIDSGQKKRSVSGLNYFDYYGERFVHVERKMGFADTVIPINDGDTYEDIRQRIESHPAYY